MQRQHGQQKDAAGSSCAQVHLHMTSVSREVGAFTGCIWIRNGSQAGSRCTSRRTHCTVDREKQTRRFCFQVHKRMLEVDYPVQQNIASLKHSVIASEAGHTWARGGWHLGNRRKSRRDRDYHGLPAGCASLERRREKTDRIGEMRG